MQPVTVCVCVLSLNIFVGVIFIASNQSWLLTTGLSGLTQKPVWLEVGILGSFIFSLIMIIAHKYSRSLNHFYALAAVSGVVFIPVCYFAMNWFFSPDMFLQSLYDLWEQNINTNVLFPIEHNFNCCGFRNVQEFAGDKCTASKTVPCMKAMKAALSQGIVGNSVFIFCQMLGQCYVIFVFRQICMTCDKGPHNRPSAL